MFFSYSALLDRVYTPQRREADSLQRAKLAGSKIASKLNLTLDNKYNASASEGRKLLQSWHASLNSTVDSILGPPRKERADLNAKYAGMKNRAEKEVKVGGTIVRINGQPFISPSGNGPIAQGYDSQASALLYDQLNPLQSILAEKEARLSAFNNLAEQMISSNEALTPQNIADLLGAWTDLASTFTTHQERSKLPPAPPALREKIFEAAEASATKKSTDLNTVVLRAKSVVEIRAGLYDFISDLDLLTPSAKEGMLDEVSAIGRNEGGEVHPFALAIGELATFNPLAIGSLLVAASIDFLVLFCGLMGARPDSYLDLKNPSDLFDIQDAAVETIMSLDLKAGASSPDPLTRRAIEIILRSEPDVDSAYNGFSAVLTKHDLEALRMSKEIGVLLALQLAEQLPDGRIGLRTRFILWLADQILRNTNQSETTRDLMDSFKQIEDDDDE